MSQSHHRKPPAPPAAIINAMCPKHSAFYHHLAEAMEPGEIAAFIDAARILAGLVEVYGIETLTVYTDRGSTRIDMAKLTEPPDP